MMQKLKTLMMILALPLVFVACGGSSSSSSGPAVDNSKASGTYSFVVIAGSSAEVGSITFDGAGGGTVTDISPTPGGPDPITYKAYADNSITLDTMVGTIREGGNFIVLSNTNSGSEALILAVKNSATAISDAANTYRFGQFGHDGSSSETVIVDVASDGAGLMNWSTIAPPSASGSGTSNYTFDNNSSGTYMITAAGGGTDDAYGAVSLDGQLYIYGDGVIADSLVYGALGLKFPGSTMGNSDLIGTYIIHQFMDESVSTGGDFMTGRIKIVADGAGNGTYSTLVMSTGGSDSGSFTSTVSADGSFVINPGAQDGFMLADGSVFVIIDTDTIGDDLDIKVGVRQ